MRGPPTTITKRSRTPSASSSSMSCVRCWTWMFFCVTIWLTRMASASRSSAVLRSCAHTVGIDAIMNMKGFAGNYGLERYPEMDALNMGSQIPCAQRLKTALERNADAILVSQIVTQKNIHVQHLTQLIELLE